MEEDDVAAVAAAAAATGLLARADLVTFSNRVICRSLSFSTKFSA